MFSRKQSFVRDERGFVAGEFALWLPILLLIILGCFEATRFILIHQKWIAATGGPV
jgi:Flp pilus assembly protein TadG